MIVKMFLSDRLHENVDEDVDIRHHQHRDSLKGKSSTFTFFSIFQLI